MIEPATPQDLSAWVGIVRECAPYYLLDEAAEAFERQHGRPGTQRVIARAAGQTVGIARFHPDADQARLLVMVSPQFRGRGVGRALWEWQVDQLHVHNLTVATSIVESDSLDIAARFGLVLRNEYVMSSLDPRLVEPAPLPSGVELMSGSDIGARQVWQIHQAVAADDPSGLTVAQPFEEYLTEWNDPRHRPELDRVAVVAGQAVAYSMVIAVADRMNSAMTGCLREYRGRGLAGSAKRAALRAAAEAGIALAYTGNDATNAPMLAINRRLGYGPNVRSYGARWTAPKVSP